MSKIQDKIVALQSGIDELKKRHAAELEEQREQESTYHVDSVNKLLIEFYRRLANVICAGCGVGDKVVLRGCNVGFADEDARKDVVDASGIKYEAKADNGSADLTVDLQEGGRKLLVPSRVNGEVQRMTLDFGLLVAENKTRGEAWIRRLPTLAEECVDKCWRCLEEIPHKYYGILETITITSDGVPILVKEPSFEFRDMRIEYRDLTNERASELQHAMNQLISHGTFSFYRINFSDLGVRLIIAPGKVVQECRYDYETFYSQYDHVTPELQKVFDHIAQNLQIVPAEDQYRELKATGKLIYWFKDGDLDYLELEKHMKEKSWDTQLMVTVTNTLEGIFVERLEFVCERRAWASPRGCARGVVMTGKRIEFSCISTGEGCDLAKSMVEVAEKIEQFKTEQWQTIVELILEKIIDHINEVLAEAGSYEFAESAMDSLSYSVLDKQEIVFTVCGMETNLWQVKDSAFIDSVLDEVNEQAKGLFTVDDKDGESYLIYRVNF